MNHKLETYGGDSFFKVMQNAKRIAAEKNVTVEFEFNEVNCLVDKNTNAEWLYRDYCNAHRMEWISIGPNCSENYSPEIESEIIKRNLIAEERAEQQRKEWEEKDKAERATFNKSVKGIELDLLDADGWKKTREVNSDGYGGAALDYAEYWAKLMQIEIAKGKTIAECYDYSQKGLGFLGITGFQFVCAVSTLSQVWKHGEELRKVHNAKYGVSEDKKGTVNPAILTTAEHTPEQ